MKDPITEDSEVSAGTALSDIKSTDGVVLKREVLLQTKIFISDDSDETQDELLQKYGL